MGQWTCLYSIIPQTILTLYFIAVANRNNACANVIESDPKIFILMSSWSTISIGIYLVTDRVGKYLKSNFRVHGVISRKMDDVGISKVHIIFSCQTLPSQTQYGSVALLWHNEKVLALLESAKNFFCISRWFRQF